VRYFDLRQGVEKLIAQHDVHLSDERATRTIDLFVPDLSDTLHLGRAVTGDDLRAMPFAQTRHFAGEKAAVLAHLRGLEALRALGVEVPDVAAVPPYRIVELLKAATWQGRSLYDLWMSLWSHDPKVGQITDERFLQSAFYTDRVYRQEKIALLRRAVAEGLSDLLVAGDRPTPAARRCSRKSSAAMR